MNGANRVIGQTTAPRRKFASRQGIGRHTSVVPVRRGSADRNVLTMGAYGGGEGQRDGHPRSASHLHNTRAGHEAISRRLNGPGTELRMLHEE